LQDPTRIPSSSIFARKKEGHQSQKRYLGIELNNCTDHYKNYNIEKYLVNIIRKIQREDLVGLDKINIYDDCFPKEQTGLYYPPEIISKGAQIDIYLDPSLGYMASIRDKKGLGGKLGEKLFIILFAKFFLAGTLLHEVGHHKYIAILKKQYETSAEQEQDANNYFNINYPKLYPSIPQYYNIINGLYRLLFKTRIEESNRFISERGIYDPEYFFRKGVMYLKRGEDKKAIEELSKVIKLDPSRYNAYFNRGLAELSLERFEEAIEDFTSGIGIKPDDPMAHYYRGYCYHSIDEVEKAIEDYTHAIELNYRIADIYLRRALCYKVLQELEKARQDFQEAINRGINESEIPCDLRDL
jgi:tetratricopeptide (TPR) repeat protein